MSEFAADKDAPVYTCEETVVSASPETVWDVISRIEEWPRWNADIKEARIELLAHVVGNVAGESAGSCLGCPSRRPRAVRHPRRLSQRKGRPARAVSAPQYSRAG